MSKRQPSSSDNLPVLPSTWVAVGFAALLWAAGLYRWSRLQPVRDPRGVIATGRRIDINREDASALALLPGIGVTLGERIVQHRAIFGRFETVDALDDVPRVGPSVLQQVRPWVVCGPLIRQPGAGEIRQGPSM